MEKDIYLIFFFLFPCDIFNYISLGIWQNGGNNRHLLEDRVEGLEREARQPHGGEAAAVEVAQQRAVVGVVARHPLLRTSLKPVARFLYELWIKK